MSEGEASGTFYKHPSWRIWTNPIFLRYCRSRLRVRTLSVWLSATLLFTCFLFFLARNIGIYQQEMEEIDALRQAFIPILFLLILFLFLLLLELHLSIGEIVFRIEILWIVSQCMLICFYTLFKILGL